MCHTPISVGDLVSSNIPAFSTGAATCGLDSFLQLSLLSCVLIWSRWPVPFSAILDLLNNCCLVSTFLTAITSLIKWSTETQSVITDITDNKSYWAFKLLVIQDNSNEILSAILSISIKGLGSNEPRNGKTDQEIITSDMILRQNVQKFTGTATWRPAGFL